MYEPDEVVGLKHILFTFGMFGTLLVGVIAIFMALMAGTNEKYLDAGVCLIASAISFCSIKFANLKLINQ